MIKWSKHWNKESMWRLKMGRLVWLYESDKEKADLVYIWKTSTLVSFSFIQFLSNQTSVQLNISLLLSVSILKLMLIKYTFQINGVYLI